MKTTAFQATAILAYVACQAAAASVETAPHTGAGVVPTAAPIEPQSRQSTHSLNPFKRVGVEGITDDPKTGLTLGGPFPPHPDFHAATTQDVDDEDEDSVEEKEEEEEDWDIPVTVLPVQSAPEPTPTQSSFTEDEDSVEEKEEEEEEDWDIPVTVQPVQSAPEPTPTQSSFTVSPVEEDDKIWHQGLSNEEGDSYTEFEVFQTLPPGYENIPYSLDSLTAALEVIIPAIDDDRPETTTTEIVELGHVTILPVDKKFPRPTPTVTKMDRETILPINEKRQLVYPGMGWEVQASPYSYPASITMPPWITEGPSTFVTKTKKN